MKNQYLSASQSQELMQLGVNMSNASAYIAVVDINGVPTEAIVSKNMADYWLDNTDIKCEPTLSVIDILNLMPECILDNGTSYSLNLDMDVENIGYWSVEEKDYLEYFDYTNGITMIDAAFELYKWYLDYKQYKLYLSCR